MSEEERVRTWLARKEHTEAEFMASTPIIDWYEEDESDKYPIRSIFELFGPKFLEDNQVSPAVRKAIHDIADCKTGALGYDVSYCPTCHTATIHACSCKNRFCPNCQQAEEKLWIDQRRSEMVPGVAAYHVVFTIPSELYPLAYANQKLVYGMMFRAVNETVCDLFQDKKFGGFKPGIISVLHTWKQTLGYHPHIHCIITGGGLTQVGQFVEGQHKGFLIPQNVLAAGFAYRLCSGLREAYNDSWLRNPGDAGRKKPKYAHGEMVLPTIEQGAGMPVLDLNDPKQWYTYCSRLEHTKWVVNIRETFNGHGDAIQYLARYIYRTAISNARIKSYTYDSLTREGTVTFTYKDYADENRIKETTVSGAEFLSRFVMHLLPKGFCRVRYGGYLANSVKVKNLKRIAQLRNTIFTVSIAKAQGKLAALVFIFKKDFTVCPVCNTKMNHFPRINQALLRRKQQREKGWAKDEVA